MLSPYSSYAKELKKTKIYFDQDFNHLDRISATCNHKDDRSTMDIDFKGYTPNGEMIVSCEICGKCFTITKYSQKEVGDALNLLYNTFQTLKCLVVKVFNFLLNCLRFVTISNVLANLMRNLIK